MTAYSVHHTLVPTVVDTLTPLYPGRTVTYSQPDASGNTTVTFTPDLTAAADDIVAVLKADAGIDVTRYASVKSDLSTLRTYIGLSSPTTAQTTAAVKSLIRVLRAMLAD